MAERSHPRRWQKTSFGEYSTFTTKQLHTVMFIEEEEGHVYAACGVCICVVCERCVCVCCLWCENKLPPLVLAWWQSLASSSTSATVTQTAHTPRPHAGTGFRCVACYASIIWAGVSRQCCPSPHCIRRGGRISRVQAFHAGHREFESKQWLSKLILVVT